MYLKNLTCTELTQDLMFVHGQADGMGAWINDYAQKPLGKKNMQRETSTGLGGFNYFYFHPYLRT